MQFDRPFKTLGSAAVKGFLHATPWFEGYRERLNNGAFAEVQPIIKRAYLGGLNMANFRGDSAIYLPLNNYCFVDIDFANAYANGNARCPMIDVDEEPEVIQAEYAWSDDTESKLKAENVPNWLIEKVKQKVADGRGAVEQLLRILRVVKRPDWTDDQSERLHRKRLYSNKAKRKRRWAKIIRNVLLTPNNTHLDRWVKQVNAGSLNYEIPGFASVRFVEKPDVQFTVLPIKKDPYGLIYVRKGETVVPACELVLAVNAGVKVEVMWSVELPVKRDEYGRAKLVFYDHLKKLVKLRIAAKANAEDSPVDSAKEQLIKEMINAFYGKSAQGLRYRKMFNPSTGEQFLLVPSEITEPSVAALTTAQVRAALTSVLLAIQEYNRGRPDKRPVVIVSATTDGLLCGFPCEPGFSVVDGYFNPPKKAGMPPTVKKEIDVPGFMQRFGHEELLERIYQYAPVKHLREMRIELTGKDDFLEIKHLADRVVCVKTRGQIGTVKYKDEEYCSLLARYGHKVPLSLIHKNPKVYEAIMKGDRESADAEWLLDRIENALKNDEIERYPFENLISLKAIMESDGDLDLVGWVQERKSNNDWDYKRQPILELYGDAGFFSKPYQSLPAMLRERRQADSIRKSGLNATPTLVGQRLKNRGSGIRSRSGDLVTLTRQFLRGYLQGRFSVEHNDTEASIADRVNHIWSDSGCQPQKTWKRSDVSNARRADWRANNLIKRSTHEVLLRQLCDEFGVDIEVAADLIFAKGVVEKSTTLVAQAVAAAIMCGPAQKIEPFLTLQRRAALPGRSELQEKLYCFLNGESIPLSPEYPPPIAGDDKSLLRKVLIQAGLSADAAILCVDALCPAGRGNWKKRKNKSQKKCLEYFVAALQMPDIHPHQLNKEDVLKKLKQFGLSRRLYSTARQKGLKKGEEIKKLKQFGVSQRVYSVARQKGLPVKPLEATAENREQIEAMATAIKGDPNKFLHALLETS